MSRPAVFLDRDGVIIEEKDYLSDPDQLCLIPGAAEAIASLNRAGIPVVVVTNQSGVARGYFPESRIQTIHDRLDAMLLSHEARIDAYFHCPHHPTEGSAPYIKKCDCRKPEPGLLLQAAEKLGLDLDRSFMIGDKSSDLEAGSRAGCFSILVRTGYGQKTAETRIEHSLKDDAVKVVDDLAEAVSFCLARLNQ